MCSHSGRDNFRVVVLARAFSPRLRQAVAGLWLVGAVITGATAVRAADRTGAASAFAFAAIGAGLVVLAVATMRVQRWALALSLVLLGLQVLGAIGSALQLVRGVEGGKSSELRRLGIDPTLGVALNLAYSAVASVLFLIAIRRAVTRSPG